MQADADEMAHRHRPILVAEWPAQTKQRYDVLSRQEFEMPLPELPPFLTRWPDGEIVLTGTRVTLYHFVFNYNQGESAEMLGLRYPHIPLAIIHKTIAFYLENKPEVDAYLVEYQAVLDKLRANGPTLNMEALRERLHSRAVSQVG